MFQSSDVDVRSCNKKAKRGCLYGVFHTDL